jgi:hypothetical protein
VLPKGDSIALNAEAMAVLPVGIGAKPTEICFSGDTSSLVVAPHHQNQYVYLRVPDVGHGQVSVSASQDVVVGEPLRTLPDRGLKFRLVLQIFVDGLTWKVLRGGGLERLMPHTNKFFENGLTFSECYSSGEWTLPSVAGLFTGRYTSSHRHFHPEDISDLGERNVLVSEYFRRAGYLTFQACQNWRKTPGYGYARGFDRTVFRNAASVGMSASEVIDVFGEHLAAFPERSHYAWLSFFELHDVFYNILPDVSAQVPLKIEDHNFTRNYDVSVFLEESGKYGRAYELAIGRLDTKLGSLYRMIEDRFDSDEILVCLNSDHGQSFLDSSQNPLRGFRTRVPFLIRGGAIPQGQSDNLVSNVDVLPTLLELCGVTGLASGVDGVSAISGSGELINGRKEVLSESIFPGQTFKACIRDSLYEVMIESETRVLANGFVQLDPFVIKAKSRLDGSAVVLSPNAQKRYTQPVRDRVAAFNETISA